MGVLIKSFGDGSLLEFDRGNFDAWCVYLTGPGQARRAPRDVEYFAAFQALGGRHGGKRIYADFVKIYARTGDKVEAGTLQLIESLASGYGADAAEIEMLFAVVYAGMIAEENKARKVVGKRLKRLGMFQVLCENVSPEQAASFSKGKKVAELRKEFSKRGFR